MIQGKGIYGFCLTKQSKAASNRQRGTERVLQEAKREQQMKCFRGVVQGGAGVSRQGNGPPRQ